MKCHKCEFLEGKNHRLTEYLNERCIKCDISNNYVHHCVMAGWVGMITGAFMFYVATVITQIF